MIPLSSIRERRADVLRVAARHGASNVRVFGSVARGQAGMSSDLDVLVNLDDECSLLDQIALIHDLEDLLGCKVDVVEEAALDHRLRGRVLAEAVAL